MGMLSLLVASMFTAFFLAVFSSLVSKLSMVLNGVAVEAVFSVLTSTIGCLLVDSYTFKEFIVKAVASAFAGKLLLSIAERISTSRPVIINQSRQD
jgi:hypothetical protein